MTILALDLETFMRLTAPPPKAVPAETFRWRDRAGNLHALSTMATRHLFFTLHMIWNHTMPASARLPGNLYTFSSYYTPAYMKDAIRALTTELAGRSDLDADWQRELNFMFNWLATRQVQTQITLPEVHQC